MIKYEICTTGGGCVGEVRVMKYVLLVGLCV